MSKILTHLANLLLEEVVLTFSCSVFEPPEHRGQTGFLTSSQWIEVTWLSLTCHLCFQHNKQDLSTDFRAICFS